MAALTYAIIPGYDTEPPVRGSEFAAGIDIYVPRRTDQFIADFKEFNEKAGLFNGCYANGTSITVSPHSRVLIPTGLKFNIPKGTYLGGENRSGVASKMGLILGPCIIDSDYQGQVFIGLINTYHQPAYIPYNSKIAQLIHREYLHSDLGRVPLDALYLEASIRGDGALGSTDAGVSFP